MFIGGGLSANIVPSLGFFVAVQAVYGVPRIGWALGAFKAPIGVIVTIAVDN